MTTQQRLTTEEQPDFSATPKQRSVPGWGRALVLALVLAALIGVAPFPASVSDGAAGVQQFSPDSALPRMTRVTAVHPGQTRTMEREMNVEALSAVVAKKYRVSYAATRSMIDLAYREARQNGLDPMLVVAVMAVESRFNPIAQSESGAMGLMQVIPRFHPDKFSDDGKNSIFDPHINIELGAKVLKEYIRRGGTEVAGLQLYNGSASDPTYAYADKVMAERQKLNDAIRRAGAKA
jgi:soluble lytic murein transglycosylase-like protein